MSCAHATYQAIATRKPTVLKTTIKTNDWQRLKDITAAQKEQESAFSIGDLLPIQKMNSLSNLNFMVLNKA